MNFKSKINKTQTMRDLHKKARKMYKNTYQPEAYIAGYMAGAEDLFDSLRFPVNHKIK